VVVLRRGGGGRGIGALCSWSEKDKIISPGMVREREEDGWQKTYLFPTTVVARWHTGLIWGEFTGISRIKKHLGKHTSFAIASG